MPGSYDEDITQEITVPEELRPQRNTLTLQIVKGPRIGEIMTIERASAVLGRGADAQLRIPDPSLSRSHARFERDGDDLVIIDLDSRNGTSVEGQRVSARTVLHNGDHIQVGNVTLRFSIQDANELKLSRALYEAAVRDRLTGMHNRGYFDDRISAEFSFTKRHKSPLALLLLDLDHFKKINDTYGHPVGDAVLKAAAAKIMESLRAEDVAARYGGEEFAVIARGTTLDGAQILAQRLRTKISIAQVLTLQGIVRVTCSIGVAVMESETPYSACSQLIAAADEALYTAKHNGRDRVVVNLDPSRTTERSPRAGSYSMTFGREDE